MLKEIQSLNGFHAGHFLRNVLQERGCDMEYAKVLK